MCCYRPSQHVSHEQKHQPSRHGGLLRGPVASDHQTPNNSRPTSCAGSCLPFPKMPNHAPSDKRVAWRNIIEGDCRARSRHRRGSQEKHRRLGAPSVSSFFFSSFVGGLLCKHLSIAVRRAGVDVSGVFHQLQMPHKKEA